MVCLHHHPITMGSRWLDTVGLAEPEAFWRVIDSHAHVRAVVWGHVHQVYDGRRGDVRLFATPSTGAQFLPKSDRYAVDSRPPAYRHFDLHADGRIDTAVHWIESLPHAPVTGTLDAPRLSRLGLMLCSLLLCVTARADGALHSLWELHGKHNTVYLLGSIHVLRPSDYPLARRRARRLRACRVACSWK